MARKDSYPAANDGEILAAGRVVVQFSKEASQTRDYCVAKGTRRFAWLAQIPFGFAQGRLSPRKECLLKDDNQTAPLPASGSGVFVWTEKLTMISNRGTR